MKNDILIVLENVSAGRADKPIINNLDWTIRRNEHWAVTGPNGSGKSTLLAALAGQIPWRSGKQIYSFLPSGKYREECIELVPERYSERKSLGIPDLYYQQRFNSCDNENSPTVRDFLSGGPGLQVKGLRGRIRLNRAARIFGIRKFFGSRLLSLSNGEMRRVFLTRAFLRRTPIVLLDKPFNGLDAEARKILDRTINRLAVRGTTVILSADENEIPACVNRTLKLETSEKPSVLLPAVGSIQWPGGSSETDSFAMAVSLRGVSVSYGGRKILDNIRWEVKAGERWAVLGPNGSGKSTLLSLICGDNPQAYANDFDLFDSKRGSGESIWDIKRRIGFLSPELHLYFPGDYRVFSAVASGIRGGGYHFALTPEEKERTRSSLELLGLSGQSDHLFRELSAGEQRLVLFARALVNRPQLLVLDEPCQGLDRHHMEYIRDLTDRICRTANLTLIYVTHKPEEIPSCVDRVLRMAGGRGTAEEYITKTI